MDDQVRDVQTSALSGIGTATRIARMATGISEHLDRKTAVQQVVHDAKQLVGCAGVMMVRLNEAHQLQIVAATDPDLMVTAVSRINDSEQTVSGRVLQRHKPELINDLATDERRTAATHRFDDKVGIRSALSVPMRSDGIDFGALTFYDDKVDYFTPDRCAAVQAYVEMATLALARVVDHVQAQNLEVALDSNREIGMAIGILMTLHKVTRENAFTLLRTISQNRHRKLRDVATEVILTGELPLLPPSRASIAP